MGMEKIIKKFIDNDCQVCYANAFTYFPDVPLITYTCEEPIECNREWKEFLKKEFNFNLTKDNLFAMSILHELGHHYTIKLFSDEEWEEETTEKKLEDVPEEEYLQAYFRLPIEYAASKWAVEVYNLNEKIMRNWNYRFYCALRHYEKKHKVKNSLLTKL